MASLKRSVTISERETKNLKMQHHLDGTLDPCPKRGPDVKCLIQTLQLGPMTGTSDGEPRSACNPFKMFKSSIQYANDSGSMDSSFEHKEIYTKQIKGKSLPRRRIPYIEEMREKLNKNENFNQSVKANKCNGNETPTKIPLLNRKNLPETPTNVSMKSEMKMSTFYEELFDLLPMSNSKKMPASSTPYKPKQDNETNNNCENEKNQMKSTTNVQQLIKCYSLTRASSRRMAESQKLNRGLHDTSSNVSAFKRATPFSMSFKENTKRSTVKDSPIVLPQIIVTKHESDLTQTCSNLSRLLEKSDQNVDDLGCTPLLTVNNVNLHSNICDENDCDETICGDDKFEFSFICEPPTSETESDDEQQFGYFPSTGCRKKLPFIPFIKGSTTPKKLCNNLNSSPFRRTASDPALLLLATNHDNNKQFERPNYARQDTVSESTIGSYRFLDVYFIELIVLIENEIQLSMKR